jgi:hypothetical protein
MIHPKLALITLFLLTTVKADDPPKSKWIRQLPDGVTVELLGICDPATKEWWTPDGQALADAPTETFATDASDPQRQARVFVVRVQGVLNSSVAWEFDDNTSGGSGSALKNGDIPIGLNRSLMVFSKPLKSKTRRMKVAGTPWATVANYWFGYGTDNPSKERSVVFSTPRATEKGTAIVAIHDYLGMEYRVEAFDKARKSLSSNVGISSMRAFCVYDAEYDHRPEAIERYELQVRALESVEFKDVPLVSAAPKP